LSNDAKERKISDYYEQGEGGKEKMTEYTYEKKVSADKGIEVYDLSGEVKDNVDELLNEHFEDVDATLKTDVEVTIKITGKDTHKKETTEEKK